MSTRARYALRAMMQLAMEPPQATTQLHSIAEAQQISVKYLEQIVRPLKLAGLVVSARGSAGGYRLGRPASEITALEIVQAVEGPVSVVDCVLRPGQCQRYPGCAARDLWQRVGEAVKEVLASDSLAELASRQHLPRRPAVSR
ncbi:MAG: Rrf2 family transcriptional regulator [Armatimonadota bacterium]